jgi:hypothetical protein
LIIDRTMGKNQKIVQLGFKLAVISDLSIPSFRKLLCSVFTPSNSTAESSSRRPLWSYRMSACAKFKPQLQLAVWFKIFMWQSHQSRTTKAFGTALTTAKHLRTFNYIQKWTGQLRREPTFIFVTESEEKNSTSTYSSYSWSGAIEQFCPTPWVLR